MGDRIVEEWLRPLSLHHYTQAFLDNGYDDLEVCKQIGEPDLDAIGVLDPHHRENILHAVRLLREQGGSAVYFTLENPDYASYSCDQPRPSSDSGAVGRRQESQVSQNRKSVFTYPRLQLTVLVQERLVEDDVRLNEQPYCDENGRLNTEALQRLASRYADELNVQVKDVLERLEEIWMAVLHPDAGQLSETEAEVENAAGEGIYSMISVYGQSSRSAPYPLPPLSAAMSCMSIGPKELDRSNEEFGSLTIRATRSSLTPSGSTGQSNAGSDAGSVASELLVKESVGSTLGRLLKSVTLRRPGKKYTYRQHEGDLNASEMMMSEDERIQLMILVKEGKLSIDEAVEMVKNHRREQRPLQYVNSNHQEAKSEYSSPFSSPSHTDSACSEPSPNHRDGKSKLPFSSPFSRQKGGSFTKESERLAHCFVPLLHRKKTEAQESPNSTKIQLFGWSPPPLPPVPRNSGIIVESMSAECMGRYNACSPLRGSKGSDIQPSLPVRKSRSLHSSVPPKMAQSDSQDDTHDKVLRTRSHHYENLNCSSGEEFIGLIDMPQNGVFHGTELLQTKSGMEVENWAVEEESMEDQDGTLTNTGQKVVMKAVQTEQPYLNNEKTDVKELNCHRSRTRRKLQKEREEPVTSSTDSLANAITSGVCGISSSSSHSSMSTEEEAVPKLAHVNRVRAKVDYIPSNGDDHEALTLKKGDIIYLLGMHDSRLCRGIHNNQIGTFRSVDVEPVQDEGTHLIITPRHTRPDKGRRHQRRPKPKTIQELLARLALEHLAQIFSHHGFNTLDDFGELDEADLDELKVTNPEERVKLLTAAQLLLDSEQNEFDPYSRSASQSPALSHDASSQTVLTHFSSRSRTTIMSPDGATSVQNTQNAEVPPLNEKTPARYPSETSSDDQEILSITRNGTIMISWGDSDTATFVTPGSAVMKQRNAASLSDSSLSSGDAASACCLHRFADELSPRKTRFSRGASTASQPGSRWSSGHGVHSSEETQTGDCRLPEVVSLRKVLAGLHQDENSSRRREGTETGEAQQLKTSSVGSSVNNGCDAVLRKASTEMSVSSPFLSDCLPLVTMKVTNSPSIKTAHVRHLVTSSPLHSCDAQYASLQSRELSSAGIPVTLADAISPGLLQKNNLNEEEMIATASEPVKPSLQELLNMLGLSSYLTQLALHRVTEINQLLLLNETQLHAIGIKNEPHIQLLIDAIAKLRYGHASCSSWAFRSAEEEKLEGSAETQVDSGVSMVSHNRRSWTMSRISTDDGCASSKPRTSQCQPKVTDRV